MSSILVTSMLASLPLDDVDTSAQRLLTLDNMTAQTPPALDGSKISAQKLLVYILY